MARVTLDPEGGYPNLSGTDGKGPKEANSEPVQIPVEQPSADTTGAIPPYRESGK